MVNYLDAVRRSFVAKLVIYLQQNGSRDMSIPMNFNQGIAEFIFENTTYGVVPRESQEDLFYPGVNIEFLDETDLSIGRMKKKRYLLTTKITITKAIEGNTTPTLAATEVIGVKHLILQALQDSKVEIWNYDQAIPSYTGVLGTYHSTGIAQDDESLAMSGGDIRKTLTLSINYADPSF